MLKTGNIYIIGPEFRFLYFVEYILFLRVFFHFLAFLGENKIEKMLVTGGCPLALSVPVSIGMLVVGYQYEENCNIEMVPFFLLLGGWILLIGSVLFLCVIDRLTKFGDVLVVLANLAFLIWSSVVIFGNFCFFFLVVKT